jgi:hypothetical protein
MSKGVRTDKLRRRPEKVRYHYLAVSTTKLHTGISYGGLDYVEKNHGVEELYLSDLLTKKITKIEEPIEDFMNRWRMHYDDPKWNYEKEIEENIPAPKFD